MRGFHKPQQRFLIVPPFPRKRIRRGELATAQFERHFEAIRVHVVEVLHTA